MRHSAVFFCPKRAFANFFPSFHLCPLGKLISRFPWSWKVRPRFNQLGFNFPLVSCTRARIDPHTLSYSALYCRLSFILCDSLECDTKHRVTALIGCLTDHGVFIKCQTTSNKSKRLKVIIVFYIFFNNYVILKVFIYLFIRK